MCNCLLNAEFLKSDFNFQIFAVLRSQVLLDTLFSASFFQADQAPHIYLVQVFLQEGSLSRCNPSQFSLDWAARLHLLVQ